MRNVGTVVRGIRTPIIKEEDDLKDIVIESLLKASESENFEFEDKDIVAITEGVVAITESNFATLDQIAKDVKEKFPGGHIGLVFPSPMSRNRLPFLKGIARAAEKITILMTYPGDIDIHNELFEEEMLEKYNIDPSKDIIEEETFLKYFGDTVHKFTGVNYVKYFREVIESEDCEVEIVLANKPEVILDYTKEILLACVHSRDKIKRYLSKYNPKTLLTLAQLMNKSVDGSGFNELYGLLGSNRITDEKLKLFPARGQKLIESIQKELKKKTGKHIEVMVYADGAFKDPSCGIWELADPVVAPFYTKGLEGTPNELKIKYISDKKYSHLNGKELNDILKEEIKNKEKDLVGKMATQGTTPRMYTDLIGSLCDLTSGSGDKGTPIVLIQRYFTDYSEE